MRKGRNAVTNNYSSSLKFAALITSTHFSGLSLVGNFLYYIRIFCSINNMPSVSNINELPQKILFEIFTHLDQTSFLNASAVCLLWNKVIEDNLDFFTSFFGDEDDDEEPLEEEQKKLIGPDGEEYLVTPNFYPHLHLNVY